MEWWAPEGTSRRMGHFPCFFCPLFPCSYPSWTEVQCSSEQVMAVQPFEVSALCAASGSEKCSMSFKTCLPLAGPECTSKNLSLLVSKEKPKCLPCELSWFLVVAVDFYFFSFVRENISKVHPLVKNQKYMQLVQIKPFEWGKDRLCSPVFQFNHPKSTAWNTRYFRKKYSI